jgi:hypothetical protein
MREGDVVFVSDFYFELDGDGGWHHLTPGSVTRALYRQISRSLSPEVEGHGP